MKVSTLCYLVRDGKVLLGLKKCGHGQGKWNGFGGKVEQGENLLGAAAREVMEETGIMLDKNEMVSRGRLTFRATDEDSWEVYLFTAHHWEGEPEETEEMGKARWFDIYELPWDKMWPADRHWLTKILTTDKNVEAEINFDPSGKQVTKMDVVEI